MMKIILQFGLCARFTAGKSKQRLTAILCLSAALMLALPASGEQPAFALEAPASVRPYTQTGLRLLLPFDGQLQLFADIGGERVPLTAGQAAGQGELLLPFTGLDAVGEPLPPGTIKLTARLTGQDRALEANAQTRVLPPAAALMYVILSRESLPSQGGEDLYADYQLSRASRLLIRLYRADDMQAPLRTWNLERKDSLPHAFRWDKKLDGQPAPEGGYVLTFEVPNSQQGALARSFRLTGEAAEAQTLAAHEPGMFLPLDAGDPASVWRAMMAPLVMVNIAAMQHQFIYSLPDTASPSLGMVHGQTAGLEVLETDINGFARIRAARHGDGAWITGYVPQNRLVIVQPDERYGLLLDKGAQTLTVYRSGRPIGSLTISTGVYIPPGTDSFDTLAGAFITQDRIAEFTNEGFRFAHAMRIDGGNLIHGTGYKVVNGTKDYSQQLAQLGRPASHGCVRVDHRISEAGINAWWLYANLPRKTKVLVLPAAEAAYASAQLEAAIRHAAAQNILPGEDVPLPEPVTTPEDLSDLPAFQVLEDLPDSQATARTGLPSAVPSDPTGTAQITLTFGGDCVLGSEERSRKLEESFDSVVARKGEAWPFSGLADIFHSDDLSMVNLENVFKDSASGMSPRLHNFRGPSAFARILTLGGVDLVNLANNHFPDYGQEGKNSTRQALNDHGISYAGYSSLHIAAFGEVRIGFAGIRETIFHQNRGRIAQEIAELKKRGADYIVYTCHFGIEYEPGHNELQTLMARTAIDAGANLVIGHHPHLVQGIERYQDGLIFYSLGNLVFGGNLELTTFDGLLAQVQLDFEGRQLRRTAVRLIPVITSGARPANDFRPQPATGTDKERILQAVNADSDRVYPERFVILPAE